MTQLTIVANIIAKPEHVELVKRELLALISKTLAEPGCLNYDLHQSNEHPEQFLFYENWQSRALWQQHMASDHIKLFGKAVNGAIASSQITEMTRISD